MSDWIIPGLLVAVTLYGTRKGIDVYDAMVTGAEKGLSMLKTLIPTLVVLLTAISMLRASGFFDALSALLSPLFSRIGLPPELLPLMLIRPFSGSGALAIGAELMATHGPNSLIGRTAAIMMGSTETTFYAMGVYFGAARVKDRGYTLIAALTADLVGFLSATLFARIL